MKKILIFFLLVSAVLPINAKKNGKGLSLELEFGPWVTNMTETSFDVLFTTPSETLAWVEIAEDDGCAWYGNEHKRFYQSVSGRRVCGKLHDIRISGLEPGKKYRYRIYGKVLENGKNAYAFEFGPEQQYGSSKKIPVVKTFDAKADSCRFSMVNDMHFNMKKYSALMDGMDAKSDFILLCGDIVSHSTAIDSVTKYTFVPIAEQAKSCPVIYARGNHEGRGKDWHLLPGLFPTSTGEFYFGFRQGPVAFIVLDAGEDKADSDVEYSGTAQYDEYRAQELEWLKQAVKDPQFVSAPQKVCLIHIPTIKKKSSWRTQNWISENFMPVLNKAGVKLMLSGHHHKYILSKPGEFGNDYTIITNSNEERLDFEATARKISVKIVDRNGVVTHSHEL